MVIVFIKTKHFTNFADLINLLWFKPFEVNQLSRIF